MKEIIYFKGSDGEIPANVFYPEGKVRAVVQFVHGITEHSGRYEEFAEYLNSHDVAFVSYDLRGHGKNKISPTASFGEGGWEKSIDDIKYCGDMIGGKFRGIPKFLLGFSLGSFLVREYLGKYPGCDEGAIIMGTGTQPKMLLGILMAVVGGEVKNGGYDNVTPLVKKLSMETYNKKFKNAKTGFDWLCSDEDEVLKYISDELCAESISSGLFYELLGSMKRTADRKIYDSYDKDMPLMVISGEDDPVGDFSKGVRKVFGRMKSGGLKNARIVLLASCRHDVLHEKRSAAAKRASEFITEFINDYTEGI